MADPGWLGAGLGAVGAAMGGAFTWLAARHKSKSDMLSSQAAMVKAAQDAATEVIATLQEQVKTLTGRIDDLEARLEAEKKARSEERHGLAGKAMAAEKRAKDAEARAAESERKLAEADGERRNLRQQLDSLQRCLRADGVDVPERPSEPIA